MFVILGLARANGVTLRRPLIGMSVHFGIGAGGVAVVCGGPPCASNLEMKRGPRQSRSPRARIGEFELYVHK